MRPRAPPRKARLGPKGHRSAAIFSASLASSSARPERSRRKPPLARTRSHAPSAFFFILQWGATFIIQIAVFIGLLFYTVSSVLIRGAELILKPLASLRMNLEAADFVVDRIVGRVKHPSKRPLELLLRPLIRSLFLLVYVVARILYGLIYYWREFLVLGIFALIFLVFEGQSVSFGDTG